MDDPRTYLPLSPQQFHILLALTDEDRHGYGIILDIAERTGGALRLGTGTLYTALAGLLDDGLIQEPARRPAADDDDGRRRYYRLAPLGRAVLHAEAERLDALVRQARRKGIQPARGLAEPKPAGRRLAGAPRGGDSRGSRLPNADPPVARGSRSTERVATVTDGRRDMLVEIRRARGGFGKFELEDADAERLRVVAEFVDILGGPS